MAGMRALLLAGLLAFAIVTNIGADEVKPSDGTTTEAKVVSPCDCGGPSIASERSEANNAMDEVGARKPGSGIGEPARAAAKAEPAPK